MRTLLACFVVLVSSFPVAAQTSCGIPGVTVTVSPAVAALGEVVDLTVTNGSSQVIDIGSSCAYVAVHPGTDCTAAPVWTRACTFPLAPLQPGESFTDTWLQNDNDGSQVPPGAYSFTVWYYDEAFTTRFECCAGVTVSPVTCPPASAVPRNGTGVNPMTLSSLQPPRLGASWEASLDCTSHAPGLALLAVFASPASGAMTPHGEILVGGTRLFRAVQAHAGSVVVFSTAVPRELALCGWTASSQALCHGAPAPRLSNALDLVLGL